MRDISLPNISSSPGTSAEAPVTKEKAIDVLNIFIERMSERIDQRYGPDSKKAKAEKREIRRLGDAIIAKIEAKAIGGGF